jgi:hypothetical protein
MNNFDLKKFLAENKNIKEETIEEFAAGSTAHRIAKSVMTLDNMVQRLTDDPQDKLLSSDIKRDIFSLLHKLD